MYCKLCQVKFNSKKDEKEHGWSLIHHRKLFRSQGKDAVHKCNLCDDISESFALFTKHINSDKHRSLMTKWIRLDITETEADEEAKATKSVENQNSKQKKETNYNAQKNSHKKGKKSAAQQPVNFSMNQPRSQFQWTDPRFPGPAALVPNRPIFNQPRMLPLFGVTPLPQQRHPVSFQQDFSRANFNLFRPPIRKPFIHKKKFSRPRRFGWDAHVQSLINTFTRSNIADADTEKSHSENENQNDYSSAHQTADKNDENLKIYDTNTPPCDVGNSKNENASSLTYINANQNIPIVKETENKAENDCENIKYKKNLESLRKLSDMSSDDDLPLSRLSHIKKKQISQYSSIKFISDPTEDNINKRIATDLDNATKGHSNTIEGTVTTINTELCIAHEADQENSTSLSLTTDTFVTEKPNVTLEEDQENSRSDFLAPDTLNTDKLPVARIAGQEDSTSVSSTHLGSLNTDASNQPESPVSEDDLPPVFLNKDSLKDVQERVKKILEESQNIASPFKANSAANESSKDNEIEDFTVEKYLPPTEELVTTDSPSEIPLSSLDDTNELLDRLEQQSYLKTVKTATETSSPCENFQTLMKQIRPVEIKVQKLPSQDHEKQKQNIVEENPKESDDSVQHVPETGKSNTEEVARIQQNTEPFFEKSNDQPSEEIEKQNYKQCAFKKPDNTVCEEKTSKKFCTYHERVLLAVEAFISQKVASTTDSPKKVSAVSLIEPENSSDHNMSQPPPLPRRKRSLSSCLSESEYAESSNSLDMSRFKRSKSSRERTYSSCHSSSETNEPTNNQTPTLPGKKTIRGTRFKYLNNLGNTGLTDIHLSNLPPTVRKLIEKKTRRTRDSHSESESETHSQDSAQHINIDNTEDDQNLDTEPLETEQSGKELAGSEVAERPSSPDSIRALFNLPHPPNTSPQKKTKDRIDFSTDLSIDIVSNPSITCNPVMKCLDNSFTKDSSHAGIQGLASTPEHVSHLPSPDISSISVVSKLSEMVQNEHLDKEVENNTSEKRSLATIPFETSQSPTKTTMLDTAIESLNETFQTAVDSGEKITDSTCNDVEMEDLSLEKETGFLELDNPANVNLSQSTISEKEKESFETVDGSGSISKTSLNCEHQQQEDNLRNIPIENGYFSIDKSTQEQVIKPKTFGLDEVNSIGKKFMTHKPSTSVSKQQSDSLVISSSLPDTMKIILPSFNTLRTPVTANVGQNARNILNSTVTSVIFNIASTTTVTSSVVTSVAKVSSGKKTSNTSRLDIGDTVNMNSKKRKEKTKANNERIPISGNTLSELHVEENKYLVKLAKANSVLENLKNRVATVQNTIATYANHIQQINEKKKDLISEINENAKQVHDSSQTSNFSLQCSSVSFDASRYVTPPSSPQDCQRTKRNTHVKATKMFSKLPSRVCCAKVYNNFVFVACEKPHCSVYVKQMKGENVAPRKITTSARHVTCIEILPSDEEKIVLCTGCVGGSVTLFQLNVQNYALKKLCKFHFSSGGCLSMHYGFDSLFTGFPDGTVQKIYKSNQRIGYLCRRFDRLGKKRRGVTCMCSYTLDGQDILFTATKHGIVYARNMIGQVVNIFKDPQNKCLLKVQVHNQKLFVVSESHAVHIFSLCLYKLFDNYSKPSATKKFRWKLLELLHHGELQTSVKISNRYGFQQSLLALADMSLYITDVVTAERLFRIGLEDISRLTEMEVYQCKRKSQITFVEKTGDKIFLGTSSGDVLCFDI